MLGDLSYAYDAAGRRTQTLGSFARTGLPQPLAPATYNAANQLTQWGATNLSYDANGNLINDGTNSYTWDARNQLDAIGGTTTASFTYDPLGRRVSKTVNGATVDFLYDGVNPVLEQPGGGQTTDLLTGLGVDEYFVRTDQLWSQHFLPDGLGSTIALTDGTGTVAKEYTYEPFGETTEVGADSTNSFQYTGRENDGTGLYYYRARYYSPRLQRFISQDPIGFVGGPNLYAYASSSPTNLRDPSGTQAQVLLIPLGPAGWAIAGGVTIAILVATNPWAQQAVGDLVSDIADALDDTFPRKFPRCQEVVCDYVGEVSEPSLVPRWKMCFYACTDGSGETIMWPINAQCPDGFSVYH